MNRSEARVLVACEFSQTTMSAFLGLGYDAYSCDLLECEGPHPDRHYQCDIKEIMKMQWDLIIVAHPPCTRLCNSGVRWYTNPPKNPPADSTPQQIEDWPQLGKKQRLDIMWLHLDQGAELFSFFLNNDCPLICIENPVMHGHAKERIVNYKAQSQSFQPWQFGHNETKRICFWLKGLPDLAPLVTKKPKELSNRVHSASPGPNRWKERSKFYSGVASEMARQWAPILDGVSNN